MNREVPLGCTKEKNQKITKNFYNKTVLLQLGLSTSCHNTTIDRIEEGEPNHDVLLLLHQPLNVREN